jgi:chromosome segregation ATPase
MDSLERKSLGLDEAQASTAVSVAAGASQQQASAREIEALKQDVAANQDSLDAGLKELKATQDSLTRLDSMEDLLGMVKRDVESNDEELVEVKQSLKRLEAPPSSENAQWWDQMASWKYLPAVATGLGVVAVGIAAFHH